jgi:excisionase family DNA binding protein
MNPLAHSIAETCVLARAGRTAIYEAINSGELIAHKRGKRTLIFASDLERWLASLPQIEAKHPVELGAVSDTAQATSRARAERKDIK